MPCLFFDAGHIECLCQLVGFCHRTLCRTGVSTAAAVHAQGDFQFAQCFAVLLPERLHGLGNIVEIMDESRPAYQLESLYRQYRGTLIGDYIKTFLKRDLTVVEKKALYYGLQALLTTKVLTSDRKRI